MSELPESDFVVSLLCPRVMLPSFQVRGTQQFPRLCEDSDRANDQ
jgi:hypothetical protein